MPRAVTALAAALLTLVGPRRSRSPRGRPRRPCGETPTPGPLYGDGHAGRYLLGGTWYFLLDPADQGEAAGPSHQSRRSTGWAPTRVPNAWNATDHSDDSQRGTVALVPQGLRAALEGRGARLEDPLRVGQLPREGLAERRAARRARGRATCRSSSRPRGLVRDGRQPARDPRRQPPRRAPTSHAATSARTAARAAAGGTTAGSCARSTCAASSASTSRASACARRSAASQQARVAAVQRRGSTTRPHARPARSGSA